MKCSKAVQHYGLGAQFLWLGTQHFSLIKEFVFPHFDHYNNELLDVCEFR